MPNSQSKLSPKLQPIFDRFVSHANKLSLHPYDWDRLYSFISDSHRLRSTALGFDIKELLSAEGFPEETASDLSSVYDHGRAIISKSKGAVFAYPGQPLDQLRSEARRQVAEMSERFGRKQVP